MRVPVFLTVFLTAVLAAGCTDGEPGDAATPGAERGEATSTPAPPDHYVELAARLHGHGVAIWFEIDLVARWQEGPEAFAAALDRIERLARVPGTVGFKVADELGYDDGLTSPAQVTRFLAAARQALRERAPGKEVLVDVIVPELGCLAWRGPAGRPCAAEARRRYPAASAATVETYLRAGLVDRVDLSTGLLEPLVYEARGLTRDRAQRLAWTRVVRRGWGAHVRLQARKALAADGGYQGSPPEAAADLATYVTVPLASGATAVDIWTWRQPYAGGTVSLLGDDLADNPLWTGLVAAHEDGAHLVTHMTPSAMPTDEDGIAAECARAAEVFDAVFVAAGTG